MIEGVRTMASRMVCAGCGAEACEAPETGRYPFRCGRARPGDDIDHVLTRRLDRSSLQFPREDALNPFVRFHTLFHSYHLARASGMTDAQYVELVQALDAAIARVDGAGFTITPFGCHQELARRLGGVGVWVKDETRNVSGSHKARHLMGILIYLEVRDALGMSSSRDRPLAIASCGNAALAAAVVARAARRELQVFIPPDAPGAVVTRLRDLAATLVVCRRDGRRGDPCYREFERAVERGAIPFCCQGSANGMTIEGGETLGYEMVTAPRVGTLDAVVIQVGGGALASSIIQAFRDAQALGACGRLPRFYTVQTRGAFPLKRAYDRWVTHRAGLQGRSGGAQVQVERYAAGHRHEFMWPWEEEPRSVARGILDDETYDWLAVMTGMVESGGRPVVVDESELIDAYALGRAATGINVDHTGAAGLAGLVRLAREGDITPNENAAVVFSGVERS